MKMAVNVDEIFLSRGLSKEKREKLRNIGKLSFGNKEYSSSSSSSESDTEDKEPLPFVIDTEPLSSKDYSIKKDCSKKQKEQERNDPKRIQLSSSLQPGINISDTYISVFPEKELHSKQSVLKKLALELSKDNELLKNSPFQEGFEKQYSVPPYLEGRKKIRRDRMKERDKTKGSNWYNLPATELTEERKNDLIVLQMRKALDPKQFYKKNDRKVLPKYFQVGTVIEHPVDFYHARIPKKDRKKTLVDELLADAEFRRYNKLKYAEIIKNQPQKYRHSQKYLKKQKKKKQ